MLPIETPRLRVRAMCADDAAEFSAYRSDPDVARFQSWATPVDVEAARRFIAEQQHLDGPTPDEWVQLAVERDGQLAGDVAVNLDTHSRVARLGYSLAPAHQGRGLASEAVGAVVDALVDDLGVHRVEAALDPRNVASARLLENLGFDHEGTAISSMFFKGAWVDDTLYGLTAERRRTWRDRPRHPPEEVRLGEVTVDNAEVVFELATHYSQRRFVAPMADSFADALFPAIENGAPVVPWLRAIEADGVLGGFMMTAERTAAHPETYLWRLLIDRWHQRRGIGDRALALLVDRLRAAGETTLLVGWSPGPGGPERFYLARGFVPTGHVDEDGEIEARLTF